MVDVFRAGFPRANPQRTVSFNLPRGRVRIVANRNVAIIAFNDNVTGAGFGFGCVHIAETNAHGFRCSVLAGECGQKLIESLSFLRRATLSENADFHDSIPFQIL